MFVTYPNVCRGLTLERNQASAPDAGVFDNRAAPVSSALGNLVQFIDRGMIGSTTRLGWDAS
jgi:hypothetical protein